MIKIMQCLMLVLESVGYTLLLLLWVAGIIYGVDSMHNGGIQREAQLSCEHNNEKPIRIKKILSVDNQIAKVELLDSSIHEYLVKEYLSDYKGHITILYNNVKVGDVMCVTN